MDWTLMPGRAQDCSGETRWLATGLGMAWKSMAVSGNVLALGNLGEKTNPSNKLKFAVDGAWGDLEGHMIHYSFSKGINAWVVKHTQYAVHEANDRRLPGVVARAAATRRRRACTTSRRGLAFGR
mgnify:CR=1 FL=1